MKETKRGGGGGGRQNDVLSTFKSAKELIHDFGEFAFVIHMEGGFSHLVVVNVPEAFPS